MNFIQTLILLLILSANEIVIPDSTWHCLIIWAVLLFLKSIADVIKKYREEN